MNNTFIKLFEWLDEYGSLVLPIAGLVAIGIGIMGWWLFN